jgi:hypothetical protein
MRRTISSILALSLVIGGAAFTFIKHGYAPRLGAMGIFMIAVGIAWLIADFRGD